VLLSQRGGRGHPQALAGPDEIWVRADHGPVCLVDLGHTCGHLVIATAGREAGPGDRPQRVSGPDDNDPGRPPPRGLGAFMV
jgi:hypothetical protein